VDQVSWVKTQCLRWEF